MTKGQSIALQADWWPAACRSQGWRLVRAGQAKWDARLENFVAP